MFSNGEGRSILFAFPYMRDLGDMVMKYITISEIKRSCQKLGIR
jgi:hypothetical protein